MKTVRNYRFVIFSGLCTLLLSCATPIIYYSGNKLSPTNSIDIYYSDHDVTKEYKVIGHLEYHNATAEKAKVKLADYAKKIGADAIIIWSPGYGADALKYN